MIVRPAGHKWHAGLGVPATHGCTWGRGTRACISKLWRALGTTCSVRHVMLSQTRVQVQRRAGVHDLCSQVPAQQAAARPACPTEVQAGPALLSCCASAARAAEGALGLTFAGPPAAVWPMHA